MNQKKIYIVRILSLCYIVMNIFKLEYYHIITLVFFLLPFNGFSQHNYAHHIIQFNNPSVVKDSTIKIVNTLKRDDGFGEAVIIQRNRNDSSADKWVREYIKNAEKKHNTLKLTKSSGCSNLDFEDGNFNSWTGQTGANSGYPAGGWVNNLVSGRHTIVSGGSDSYASAGNPITLPAPGGGTFSVKLGNDNSNYEAEQLIYTFTVQPADTNFIYKYAVVLQDAGHTPPEQPYFDFKILDQSGSNIVSCSFQHYVAAGGLPGFFVSPADGSVYFKPWTTVGINLSSYVGQQITLIATTADCSQGGHFGYAYLDFICPSLFTSSSNIYCDTQTSVVINAPVVEQGMVFNWSTGDTTSSITIDPQLYNGSSVNCFIKSPTSVGLCGFWYVFPIQVIEFNPEFNFTTNCLTANFTDSSTVNSGSIQSWLWDFGDGNTSATQNASHTYNTSGTFNATLTITTASCGQKTVTHPVTLTGISLSENSTNILCYGDNNATATVIATGAPPYTYVWSPNPPVGQGTNNISGLSAGTWTVQITNFSGCSTTNTITIIQPTVLVATIPTSTNILCFGGNNGTATASAIGGTGTYTYLWNDPAPAQTEITATNLTAGTWTVQVTDSNLCTASASVTITQPALLNATIPTLTNVSCYGGNNGIATALATGGTGTYIYLWNDPAPAQTTITATGLSAGTWTVQVTDTNLCTASISVTVTEPALLNALIPTHTNVSCFGGSDGTATASATGGTGTYNYLWNDPAPAQTTITATSLTAGTWTVQVTDINLCTASASVTITESAQLNATIPTQINVSCFDGSNGTASASATGGTGTYTYLWNNPAPAQTTITATSLTAGTWTVLVTDANSCSDTANVIISEPALLTENINTLTDITCYGGSDGTASVNVNGGTLPYIYTWAANPLNNFNSITGLSKGNSSVTVTDVNGCIDTVSFTLTEPLELIISTSPNVTICNGGSATLAINATGGTLPYFYFWNNQAGASTFVVNPDSTLSYLAHVVDINGCLSATSVINVTVGLPISVQVTSLIDSICPGDSTEIFITALNGTGGPYMLTLPDGTIIPTPYTVHPQTTQQYIIQASDLCHSKDVDSVIIYVYPKPPVNITADKYSGCTPLRVQFNETSPNEGQTYLWNFDSPDENNLSFAKNPVHVFDIPGTYDISQTVTSVYGCKSYLIIPEMIVMYPLPDARFTYNPSNPPIINPDIDFTNISSGNVENYWSFGDGDSSLAINPEHLYKHVGDYPVSLITISDKGCRDTMIEIVKISDVFTFYAPTAFSPDNDSKNDKFYVYASGIDETSFHLMIYDRWGELIFKADDILKGWDGKVGGEMSQTSTYAWLAIFKDFSGNQKTQAGKVTLIR